MPNIEKKIDYLEHEDVPMISLPKNKTVTHNLEGLTRLAEHVKSIQKQDVVVPSRDLVKKVKAFRNPFDKDKKNVVWL